MASARVTVVGSGSSGNAVLVESRGSALLVDAGIAPRTVRRRLRSVRGANAPVPARLDGIIVTHGHGDHTRHAEALARSFDAPVFATRETAEDTDLEQLPGYRAFRARYPFKVGAFSVDPLAVPHDSSQVSLVLDDGAVRIGIATDFGEAPSGLAGHLSGCDVLLVESNHDPALLARGSYPPFLKTRISSGMGHLSNEQAARLLASIEPCAPHVVLMHLSETNNRPELALAAAWEALRGRGVTIYAAHQRTPLCIEVPGTGQLGFTFD